MEKKRNPYRFEVHWAYFPYLAEECYCIWDSEEGKIMEPWQEFRLLGCEGVQKMKEKCHQMNLKLSPTFVAERRSGILAPLEIIEEY